MARAVSRPAIRPYRWPTGRPDRHVGAYSSESISERIVEEASVAAGRGEVDVDPDGDGTISIKGSEVSMSFGGVELSASLPAQLPLPERDEEGASSFERAGGVRGPTVTPLRAVAV